MAQPLGPVLLVLFRVQRLLKNAPSARLVKDHVLESGKRYLRTVLLSVLNIEY